MEQISRPVRVLCLVALVDEHFYQNLRTHLAPLVASGLIELRCWTDSADRSQENSDLQIKESDVVIPLVSADFLASERSADAIRRALDARHAGRIEMVLVVVRSSSLKYSPLADFEALPDNGRAVASWANPDEAWQDVVDGIARLTLALRRSSRKESPASLAPDLEVDSWPTPGPEIEQGPASLGAAPEVPRQAPTLISPTMTREPPPLALGAAPESPRQAGQIIARTAEDVEEIPAPTETAPPTLGSTETSPPSRVLSVHDIFRTIGQPGINFVEPEQLSEIRVRLRMMGQGLVVEGPSGVGKTTAVRRALSELAPGTPLIFLSSKRPSDSSRLAGILDNSLAEGGHLVIDDFHRLRADLQQGVADLIKIVADEDRRDAKVTLIGISPVGLSLVQDFPDLANRFAVISMRKQSPEKIDELIRKGARAANVHFAQHAELVKEAAGSFYTAQLLCLEAALKEGVTETSPVLRTVSIGPRGYVMDRVLQSLAFKYHAALMTFATCDERPPPRGACLSLLWLLSQSEDASVSLSSARFRYPQIRPAFDWLMASNLGRHFDNHPRLRELFYYNREAAVLSAEDPQLELYLRNMRWEAFARDTGHENIRWDIERGPLFDASLARAVEPAPDVDRVSTALSPLPESSILHLSDLHFGTKVDAVLWADQLLSDLRNELGQRAVDVVVLSGDIANFASTEEYRAAAYFLFLLKQELRLSPQQMVLVPGNHDVSWAVSKSAYVPVRRSDHKGALEEGQFIDGGHYVEIREEARYPRRFAAFAEFYHDVRLETYPLEYEQQATLHHFPAQRLLVLGLNSAWALDHHFTTRPGIHQAALGQALRLVRTTEAYGQCLKLAVFHHPIHGEGEDRIKDSGFLERLAVEGFRVALHGHIHKAQTDSFRHDVTSGGRAVHLAGAGTFGAPVREMVPGYPLQYQLLRVHGETVTVETRRREERGGAWKPDARWLQGAGKDPLPRYEITVL